MGAITQPRPLRNLDSNKKSTRTPPYPIAAATILLKGAMIGLNNAGYLVNMTGAANVVCLGIADRTYENTTTPDQFADLEMQGAGPNVTIAGVAAAIGAAGGLAGVAEQGWFEMFNDVGGNAIAMTDVGTSIYAIDNQTVSKNNAGSKAGTVVYVDPISGLVVVSFDPFAGRP